MNSLLDITAIGRHTTKCRANAPGRVQPPGLVIQLKERSLVMLTNDLILRNPLRLLGSTGDEILEPGALGAVLARHGVGKRP